MISTSRITVLSWIDVSHSVGRKIWPVNPSIVNPSLFPKNIYLMSMAMMMKMKMAMMIMFMHVVLARESTGTPLIP